MKSKPGATWQEQSAGRPTQRQAISTWTSGGQRLAPRRATDR